MSREVSGTVVTVAELMRRCAPVADGDDDTGEPIPVSTLLRREGRARRPFERAEVPAPTAVPARGALVRRGVIAAGALVAAGSVFALTTAMNAPGLPTVTGTYPDQGAPDGGAADPASALDPGTAAPTSWLPVAFPTAFASDVVKRAVAAAPVTATTAGAAPAGAAPASAAGPASTSKSRTSTPTTTTRSKSLVSDTTKKLGDTVDEVGKGTPVGNVTRVVGSTVTGVGRTLDATTAPVTSGALPTTKHGADRLGHPDVGQHPDVQRLVGAVLDDRDGQHRDRLLGS